MSFFGKPWFIAGAAIVLLVAAVLYKAFPPDAESPRASGLKSYGSSTYGISFDYSDRYALTQADVGDAIRDHHVISLRPAGIDPAPKGGETPPAITIDIYENDRDAWSDESFITGTEFSNYKLSHGGLRRTPHGSLEGLEYDWSGLYEGRSFVVSRPGYIFVFTVTYIGAHDQIVADWESIVGGTVLK